VVWKHTTEKRWCKLKKCGIYALKNIVNNKMYIGQSTDIDARKYHHYYDLKHHKHHSCKLQQDYDLYGENNFEFLILEECLFSELSDKEKYYVDMYHTMENGYNVVGGGTKGHYVGKETKQKISKNHSDVRGEKNPAYGIPIKQRIKDFENWKKKIGQHSKGNQNWKKVKHRPSKPCILYDIYGKVINKYDKLSDCLKENNFKNIPIGSWTKGYYIGDEKRPFHWNIKNNPYIFNNICFLNLQDVADYIGIKKDSLKKSKNKWKNGLVRKMTLDDIPLVDNNIIKKFDKNSDVFKYKVTVNSKNHYCKHILMFDLNNNFIKEFTSIKEASVETNILDSSLVRCCQNKQKTAGGYIWKYKN
jgi:group I intron endonuclease